MKKYIRILICFALIFCTALFAGCGKEQSGRTDRPPAIPAAFTADVEADTPIQNFKAQLEYRGLTDCVLRFTQPATMNGVCMIWNGQTVRMQYKGVGFDVDVSKFPQSAIGSDIINSVNAAVKAENLKIEKTGEDWSYSGSTKSGSFTIIQDGNTGFIRSISLPDNKVQILFTNFQTITAE